MASKKKNNIQVIRFWETSKNTLDLKNKEESDLPEIEGRQSIKSHGYQPLSKASERKVTQAIDAATALSNKRAKNKCDESFIYNELTKTNDNICNGKNGALVLNVQRGKFVGEAHYCADCLSLEKNIWRYQDSNYGTVYLCGPCKIIAFERSFGYADAMPLKIDHAHAHKGKW